MRDLQPIRIETARAVLEFAVEDDGLLRQRRFGGRSASPYCDLAYPAGGDGWVFEPALRVVHADGNTSTDLRVASVAIEGGLTRISMRDPVYPFFVDLMFQARFEDDVIEAWAVMWHSEESPVELKDYASSALYFGAGDLYLTQFRGDWNDEMHMEEERLGFGLKTLDSKLGVRAHRFRSPWFLLAKGGPAQEAEGEVFAGSLAWPGSFRFAFEKLPTGDTHAICGINPYAAEFHLAPGERFETPRMVWSYSADGTRQLSHGLHRWVRSHVLRDPGRIRSVVLNNWEATHFQFDEASVKSLCKGASEIGIETFLLDDGWFGSKYPRDNDMQGLGDWSSNLRKLPHGIASLVSSARERGLRFGIWIEPEMMSPLSELFEKHPDWAIQQPKRAIDLQRNQLVLDLTRPEVKAFVLDAVDRLLRESPDISYVKWDCNRHVSQPGSSYLATDRQSHLGIEYMRALLAIFGQAAARHPNVELMMCAGGGGRIDYGSMRYAHELWPSDNTDPARRIFIQWGYSHFYPANAISAHVTRMGNRPLKFAVDVAMSGRFGMDINLAELTPDELAFSARAIATYKEIRDVVQFGVLYRLESPYAGSRSALMYVLGDRTVVFAFSLGASPEARLVLAGLDKDRTYKIREINRTEGCGAEMFASGGHLSSAGLSLPELGKYESKVFGLRAE